MPGDSVAPPPRRARGAACGELELTSRSTSSRPHLAGGTLSVYRHCQTNLLALVAQARDPARARLEVRRAVLPSGIRLTTWITVGVRRDPTTTPLIERGPPGFSSAGSAARHLPAYEHVYQRRQHPHLSAACAQDLPATTAEAGQTAMPSPSPPVITSISPPTFKSPSSSPSQ